MSDDSTTANSYQATTSYLVPSLTTSPFNMQAALCLAPRPVPTQSPKNTSIPASSFSKLSSRSASSVRATAVGYDSKFTAVNYNSSFSVFPAEACEIIGGDACAADTYPEVKPRPEGRNNLNRIASEMIEREYLDYNEPKTVLPADACDVLGGGFCERPYQRGVY
ncbi:hypothetical protein NMG60_11026777 [Bertholletia excelsa]